MKYTAILSVVLVVAICDLSTAIQSKCAHLYAECDTKNLMCCDGLRCEASQSNDKKSYCQNRWAVEPANLKGDRVDREEIMEAFAVSLEGSSPCYQLGANCAMTPTGCCQGLECIEDAFQLWSCQPQH